MFKTRQINGSIRSLHTRRSIAIRWAQHLPGKILYSLIYIHMIDRVASATKKKVFSFWSADDLSFGHLKKNIWIFYIYGNKYLYIIITMIIEYHTLKEYMQKKRSKKNCIYGNWVKECGCGSFLPSLYHYNYCLLLLLFYALISIVIVFAEPIVPLWVCFRKKWYLEMPLYSDNISKETAGFWNIPIAKPSTQC